MAHSKEFHGLEKRNMTVRNISILTDWARLLLYNNYYARVNNLGT
jgi:hypothetical protein